MNRTIAHIPDDIWRPDVTVACIVPREGAFLLVEESVRGELVLNQPAGHLEPHETLGAAALRETLEETGWKVQLAHLVGIYQWTNPGTDSHFLRFTFAATAVDHDPTRRLDDGIVRAVWMTRDEIAAERERLRSPMVLRSVDDFLAGKRQPLDTLVAIAAST
jgi:ADP-ribose pyrophosphatase YjhB (NUDIX family)